MSLPLMPAARAGGGRRLAGAALLIVLALAAAAGGARLRAAHAADDASQYSATVPVDATADSVMKAREMARIDGARRALAAVVGKLSGSATAAKLPKLDDQAITDMVASFQVANERMSAVRYLADYTFSFRPGAVQRVMSKAGIAMAGEPGAAPPSSGAPGPPPRPQAANPGQPGGPPPANGNPGPVAQLGKPLVILPVFHGAAAQTAAAATLWDDPNPWRDAWDNQPPPSGPVPLVVPLGDAGDLAAIDAAKARAGDAGALAAIAKRNGGDAASVAIAELRGPPDAPTGVDVTVRDYRAGQLAATHVEPTVAANPGESGGALLGRAAAAVTSDIEGGWKKAQAANYDQQGSLTAVLPITSLDDWVRARDRLAAVPQIRNLALVALSRQEATIEIDYAGSIDQLKSGLAQISLDLQRGDPLWRLARSGPDQAQ